MRQSQQQPQGCNVCAFHNFDILNTLTLQQQQQQDGLLTCKNNKVFPQKRKKQQQHKNGVEESERKQHISVVTT